ncbi:MAG TPA: D-alanine--poly(phosphoribitol) ligase subunit DltC [Verrucomicrobiae bacterium]|nr:D-alanine--poly(phosphoribitol) ligase subunit DltC [Verrucomicrobiae bacterium]
MKVDGAVAGRTLELLCEVAGDDEVARDLDVPLFASGLIDSLGVVRLLVAFEDAFGLVISPAELDRETWSTPRALIADIERRLERAGAA